MYTKEEERERAKILDLIQQADAAIAQAHDFLASQGEILDLTEWVTIKEYCKRFGIENTETVSNWVRRGQIPPEDTRIVEEFNNIRLVRAKEYHVGAGTPERAKSA